MPQEHISILTIGYGQRDLAGLLSQRQRYGATYLGDILDVPVSSATLSAFIDETTVEAAW